MCTYPAVRGPCGLYKPAQTGQGGGRGPGGECSGLECWPYIGKMGQTRQCRPDTQFSSFFEPASRIARSTIERGHIWLARCRSSACSAVIIHPPCTTALGHALALKVGSGRFIGGLDHIYGRTSALRALSTTHVDKRLAAHRDELRVHVVVHCGGDLAFAGGEPAGSNMGTTRVGRRELYKLSFSFLPLLGL